MLILYFEVSVPEFIPAILHTMDQLLVDTRLQRTIHIRMMYNCHLTSQKGMSFLSVVISQCSLG